MPNAMLPTYTTLLDFLATPTFLPSLLVFCVLQFAVYELLIAVFPRHFATVKQRGWILTTVSSLIMTAVSIPYLADLFDHIFISGPVGATMRTAPCMLGWKQTSEVIGAFFVSYCVMDMALGKHLYPSEMNPWSGYFHHSLYSFMVTNLAQRGLSGAFAIFGVLEAPTLLMSVAQIHRPLRNDNLFGAVFFATRIAFHVSLTLHLAIFAYPGTLVFLYPASVLPLHVMWFNGWIKQQRRLRAKRVAAAHTATSAPIATAVPAAAAVVASTSTTRTTIAQKPALFFSSIHAKAQAYRKALAAKVMLQRSSSSLSASACSSDSDLPGSSQGTPSQLRRPQRHLRRGSWATQMPSPTMQMKTGGHGGPEEGGKVVMA
ncbi:hypothetical protein HK101_011856 [Irineochytrium annulatum]|nr:hypothetical protein HK101_011856 [Irineochytrium annulatum]